MNSDERILKALEDLQVGQKSLQTDAVSIKDVQQEQGKQLAEQGKQLTEQGTQLETLQTDLKGLHRKVDTVELKAEAIHEYQKQAHDEIVEKLFESNEINGQEQKALEKRIERIEKHLGLGRLNRLICLDHFLDLSN
jgi:septal ring factor EnvC (AmiA/AmiB activator)